MGDVTETKNAFNTLIVKIASRCNIDCNYCYEYNRGDESWRSKPKKLSLLTAKKIGIRIAEFCSETTCSEFTVVFHGGEPLSVGANYLQQIIDQLKSEITPEVCLRFGLQTNGLLVSDEFINIFQRNNISVGISLDGDAYANRNRVDKRGRQTFSAVVDSIQKVQKSGCLSGIQAVIDLWSMPEIVLEYLASFGPTLIELSQPLGSHDNPPHKASPPLLLGEWLTRAYDFWESSECMRGTKIAVFTEALRSIMHGKGASDWFPGLPPNYLIVASDGDYEGLDTLKVAGSAGRLLGLNVHNHTIQQALGHQEIRFRGSEISLPDDCRGCPISDWCCGGAYPSRFGNGRGFNNSSIYCGDMKKIFKHLGVALIRSKVDEELKIFIEQRLRGLTESHQFGAVP